MIVQKVTLVHPTTVISGMGRTPGESGILVVKQDDISGRNFTLGGEGNIGTVGAQDALPREIYTLRWYRTDEHCFWEMGDKVKGIFSTVIPVIRVDDYLNELEVLHHLPDSELEISVNNGPWIQYTGTMQIGAVDRPAGYYRARVKDDPSRTVSPIAYSLPFKSQTEGFPYILNLILK